MDATAIQSLERAFWYRLGGGVAAGTVLAVAAAYVLAAGAAVEWTAFGLGDAVGVTDPVFWAGLGLVFVGGLVGFWADHAGSGRAADSG